MSELMQASNQWASRPSDERFTSLTELLQARLLSRSQSKAVVVSSRAVTANPLSDNKGLVITGPNGHAYAPTNHAFGQLAQLAGAPAGYLRTLASPLVADCLNYGLKINREVEDVGMLLQRNGSSILRAATGPNYGRIWDADFVGAMVERFGNGRDGQFTIPGEFGKEVEITKANTTIYGSDRDMFVFLADEKNRINVKGRRNGFNGTVARGFFGWNSEVGGKTLGVASFLFDYACCNRIVWGATEFKQLALRHTVSAPDRFMEEIMPVIQAYANGSAKPFEDAIALAQAKKVDDVSSFMAARFGKGVVDKMLAVHMLEEHRPVETMWDVVTAATAYAKGIGHQDARVAIETAAGKVLDLVAA